MQVSVRDITHQEHINKYWAYKGKYLGKLIKVSAVGRVYDPDFLCEFEHGNVEGLGLYFDEVPSRVSAISETSVKSSSTKP
jgi:hypothetical protein